MRSLNFSTFSLTQLPYIFYFVNNVLEYYAISFLAPESPTRLNLLADAEALTMTVLDGIDHHRSLPPYHIEILKKKGFFF